MSPANVLNRCAVELSKKPQLTSPSHEVASVSSSSSFCTSSKSVSFSSFILTPSSKRLREKQHDNNAKNVPLEKEGDDDESSAESKRSEELCSSSIFTTEKAEITEESEEMHFLEEESTEETEKPEHSDASKDTSSACCTDGASVTAEATNTVVKQKNREEVAGSTIQLENCQKSNLQLQRRAVSSVSLQSDPSSPTPPPGPLMAELLPNQQKTAAPTTDDTSSAYITTVCRSLGKQDDDISTRAVTPVESLSFEVTEVAQKDTNGDKPNCNTCQKGFQSSKGDQKGADAQYFLLRFAKCGRTLVLRDEEVIEQFEYFSGITEGNFSESKTQIVEMSEHLPYEIAQLVLQPESKMISSIKKENVCSVIEVLDYLGFKYSDDFVHHLFRKIHRHRWTEEKQFASEIVHTCAYTNIGVHLMSYLKRSPGIISRLLCKEGGQLVAEMCEKNADKTISLLNDVCHNLYSCRPESKDVMEFIIAATQQQTLVDALAEIWDPTLWYSTEKKSVVRNAMSDGPHQVGEVDVELYADSDNQGSSTTVNICMSGGSPLDGATPLSQVTNLGIYASARGKATYVYTCFTARAKFKLKDLLLGEATFDLYPDGVKAFCPVVSGGPHMHGLQLTCRIDEKIKELKEDYRSRYNIDIGNQRIDDISVELKSRQFPFRGLSLYLLHNAVLQNDFKFVTLFASALESDVCEWLGTYLTPLWVQQSFPDHSYSYIAPSKLNSLPSPFVVLQHWFADARVPIDTWCSKTIMGELFQSNNFQLLMSRHFSDCLNFIKSCKKWVDTESLLLFREKLIEFVSHKPHIVGALLFDLACEATATQNSSVSDKLRISEVLSHDPKEEQDLNKPSSRADSYSCSSSMGISSSSSVVSHGIRRTSQQNSSAAPNKQSSQSAGNVSFGCNSSTGSKPLTCRQALDVEVHGRSKGIEGHTVGHCAGASSSSCNMQVHGKQQKALDEVLKEVESMDWGFSDWLNDSSKETTTGKSKRCRLC